jgi:ribosomal protein S18 acetylase RimI-like enzyme
MMMKKWSLQFHSVADLDSTARDDSANLIYESFAEFYDLLPVPLDARISAIVSQFDLRGTELATTISACLEDRVVGVYSALPAKRLTVAQIVGVNAFSKMLDPSVRRDFRAGLSVFATQIPPVPEDSFYLARFAIAAEHRGTGLAGRILDHFFVARGGHGRCSIHARSNNARAIGFYEKHGFTRCNGGSTNYLSLCRWLGATGH